MPERPRPKLDRVREQLRRDEDDATGFDPERGPDPDRVTEEADRTEDPSGDDD